LQAVPSLIRVKRSVLGVVRTAGIAGMRRRKSGGPGIAVGCRCRVREGPVPAVSRFIETKIVNKLIIIKVFFWGEFQAPDHITDNPF